MPNTLDDLRDHLFKTLEDLRNKEKPMEIDRAKAISEVAQTVIASAKVEVDYIRAVGRDDLNLPVFGQKQLEGPGSVEPGVRTHRIK